MKAAHVANHLVDQYQTHLKFNGRTPRTLQELLVAKADYEHGRRRAEVKVMTAKLALLDATLPALAERGIALSRRDIGTSDHGKTLRIQPSIFCPRDDKLYAALIELGFKEIERRDLYRDEQQVTLKHGRSLMVCIDVTKAPVAETAGSTS